jgi:uncharacterized protein
VTSSGRPRRNPFEYGVLVADRSFTDRADELNELKTDLRNGQNVALVAQRRFGKSSLVHAALRDLIKEGFLVAEVDLMTTPTKERLAAKLAKTIHDDIASAVFKAKERLRVFSSLRVAPTMSVDVHGSVTFSFAPARHEGEIDDTLERLFELPAAIAAEQRKQVVMFFDEFQEITNIDPRLPALMRAIFQRQSNVAHVYAGSRREMMHRLFNDKNEPFYRSAKTIEIGPIPKDAFAAFVKRQFERTDRAVAEDAVARLLEITGGHPYATQELAYALWEEVPEGFTASAADLDEALKAVLRAENAHFTLLWENASRAQKLILQALAEESGRPFSNAYRLRHSLPAPSGVQRALKPLVEAETVARHREGHYELAEPFLREWIRMHVA